MRERAYRAHLARRGLGAASIESYVDYLNRVERLFGAIDACDLASEGLGRLQGQMKHAVREGAMARNSMNNCMTALRRYAELD